jgi:hypothetical protein
MLVAISLVPWAAWWTLLAISHVAAPCYSTAEAIVVADLAHLVDRAADAADRADSLLGRSLDFADLRSDFLGGLGGLRRQRFDLTGDHGKALAGVTGPSPPRSSR